MANLTLAQMLALLPDNDSGLIDAVDVRDIITAIFERTDGTNEINGLQFDTMAPDPAHSPGRVHWSADDQTLNVDSEFSNVALQLGQEQWIRVRNTSGAMILNGRAVRIAGATGQTPVIALDNGQGTVAGVATQDIANNSFGMVTTFGLVRDVNTSAFADGARVYSTATGTLTTAFTGSFVGIITLAHPTQGVILVTRAPEARAAGTTAQRPTVRPTGFDYFDTTLGIPISWNGTAWVNASGGVV